MTNPTPEAATTAETCREGCKCGKPHMCPAQPANEVTANKIDEVFTTHLEREGYEVTRDPVGNYPQKFATFLAGAEYGYAQRPDVAALKALIESACNKHTEDVRGMAEVGE